MISIQSMELHRHILPNFANHVLTLAFDQLLAVISSFHVPIATLRTVHSLLLHPLLGTSYLQTFVTVQPSQHS